jgi:hypothetical protein
LIDLVLHVSKGLVADLNQARPGLLEVHDGEDDGADQHDHHRRRQEVAVDLEPGGVSHHHHAEQRGELEQEQQPGRSPVLVGGDTIQVQIHHLVERLDEQKHDGRVVVVLRHRSSLRPEIVLELFGLRDRCFHGLFSRLRRASVGIFAKELERPLAVRLGEQLRTQRGRADGVRLVDHEMAARVETRLRARVGEGQQEPEQAEDGRLHRRRLPAARLARSRRRLPSRKPISVPIANSTSIARPTTHKLVWK